MGKRIRVQRRGRGTSVFRSATHKRAAPVRYPVTWSSGRSLAGEIESLLHDPGRGAPIASVRLENDVTFFNVAPEGAYEGQRLEVGEGVPAKLGAVLALSQVPEGTLVYNIERLPGDGGKFVRSSGGYATVISHTPNQTVVKMTSGKTVYLDSRCRCTVGVVAAGGRTEKPFVKAGERFRLMKAKGHKYPLVRGVSMIAAVHPHGGGRHKHPGKPMTVGRGTPPGRKIGLIAARQTGRAKKTREVFSV